MIFLASWTCKHLKFYNCVHTHVGQEFLYTWKERKRVGIIQIIARNIWKNFHAWSRIKVSKTIHHPSLKTMPLLNRWIECSKINFKKKFKNWILLGCWSAGMNIKTSSVNFSPLPSNIWILNLKNSAFVTGAEISSASGVVSTWRKHLHF